MSDGEIEEVQPLDGPSVEVSTAGEVQTGYKCDVCGKNFKHKSNLYRHMHVHGENSFWCKRCTQYFGSQKALDKHSSEKHVPCICEVCGKQYERKGDLIVHLKKHNASSDNELVCPFDGCRKVFVKNTVYQDHLNTHTGLQPYSCSECHAKFESRYERNIHQRVCAGETEYRCKVCNNLFLHRGSLHNHYETMHSGKTFICRCGRRFAYRSGLRRHQVKKKHLDTLGE